MCDKLENRGDLIFGILVKKLKYIDVFFILGIVYHHWNRRGGREEGKEEGGRWALDCAAHQIKQILCKDSVVFWGVNFCGEGAGREEVQNKNLLVQKNILGPQTNC